MANGDYFDTNNMSTAAHRKRSGRNGGSGSYKSHSNQSSYKTAAASTGSRVGAMDFTVNDIAKPKILYIHVKDPSDGSKLVAMKQQLSHYSGDDEVILVIGNKKGAVRMPAGTRICDELTEAVSSIYGSDCVAVK